MPGYGKEYKKPITHKLWHRTPETGERVMVKPRQAVKEEPNQAVQRTNKGSAGDAPTGMKKQNQRQDVPDKRPFGRDTKSATRSNRYDRGQKI